MLFLKHKTHQHNVTIYQFCFEVSTYQNTIELGKIQGYSAKHIILTTCLIRNVTGHRLLRSSRDVPRTVLIK